MIEGDKELLDKVAECLSNKINAKRGGKSILDLSVGSEVDERSLRRILKSEQNLSIGAFKRICKALNIKMSTLLRQIGE